MMRLPVLPASLARWLTAGLVVATLAGCIPIPVIEVSPNKVVAGEEVEFNASGTMVSAMPTNNRAISYDWRFGDGDSDDGETVTHTYSTPGTYTVTLTVIDSAGREGRSTEIIEVQEAPLPDDETETQTSSSEEDDAEEVPASSSDDDE